MTLSDWTIYKVKRSGSYWHVQLQYASATSRKANSKLFTDTFSGNQQSFVVINGVKTLYAGFDLPRGSVTKVNIYLQPKLKDYYYFPPFLSWNWDLSLDAWYPTSDNTFTVTATGPVTQTDPFELGSNPFSWSVKTVGSVTAGQRTLTLVQAGSAGENKTLRYSQTFFLKNQIIYINEKQYRIARPAARTTAYEVSLEVFEESYTPSILEAVTVPTLNSFYIEPTIGKNIFEDLFEKNSIPTGSLKIFYDFTSYEDSHVKSVAPAASGTYSGQIVGDFTEFSTTVNGEGYFNRDNYLKIKNADELFSRKFSFIFANSKTDNSPSTMFSNFGGYTNPTSGFAIGLNSANKLYFQNYNELSPYIATLNTHNARKNIFCVLGDENSIQLGRYNVDKACFDILDATLNSNFIRQSNNWYLGTGVAASTENYSYDGYMDYFMYFNQTLGVDQANIIASGFYNQITGVAPTIRTIPGDITGYTEVLTGVTGYIGYSGVLSGQEMTRYTGYAVTGSGITGRLTITGDYNLYITGDTYSGFYMQANLDDYETGVTGSTFYKVAGGGSDEVSAIAYDPNRNSLLVPKTDNSNTPICELDLEGNLIRTISSTFDSIEGMCYMTGYFFALGEESASSPANSSKIHYGPIKKTNTNLGATSPGWNTITLETWDTPSNQGLEGITFNKKESCFYAVKEGGTNSKGVYRIKFDGSSGFMFNPSFATDLADIHFDEKSNNFFLLSEQDNKIYQTTTGGSLLYEKSVPMTQPEGITFTSDVKRMYVAGEPKEGGYFRLNENLVNTYELLRGYTGFFSGNQQFELSLFEEKLFSGLNIQPITGFGTGLSKYEYTGYSNVYVQSGISGYLHSGYAYTALTGDPTGILIENSGNTTIASSEVYDYFYDKISYLLSRSPDMVEYNYKRFDINNPISLSYGKKYNQQGHYEWASELATGAFTLNTDAADDQVNLYLNGVSQHQGVLKTSQNDLYENIYDTLTGDYSLIDSMIVNDRNFQTQSRGQDEVIYDTLQSTELRQTTGITNTSEWVNARALGITGDGVQAFINGQKIYSGAHLDYVVKEGFISGQNYLTGITGHLTTYPDYTDLVTSTGVGLYDLTGRFLLDNVYYLNGVRQNPNNFLVYATGVSLIVGTGVRIEGKQYITYNTSINYGD